MKTMMVSDFCAMKSALVQMAGILAAAGIVMAWAMDTAVGAAAAVGAMAPFMYLFSVGALDEQNGWERFRLTLPLTRRQVVFGRYGSTAVVAVAAAVGGLLVGLLVTAVADAVGNEGGLLAGLSSAQNPPEALVCSVVLTLTVFLVGAAVALPLMARFGMTKATRFVPLVVVLAMVLGIAALDTPLSSGVLAEWGAWVTGDVWHGALLVGGALLVAAVLYGASAFIAARLYEQREF
ncbi:ABC-2 transporter permease [Adlercreutzia equolifaciens]|uniref:ABC-2 transporter permease n=1 Tax=Adlercreutzia equolifaciens TaxID=446660 RepID=UPI0023AEC3C2|nr:ABC-2 transporter permease [Adlercreutzia equolifaciens]MDE8702040.1 ABC-2 transporter permease [Adlercreutzia equolifaciens]